MNALTVAENASGLCEIHIIILTSPHENWQCNKCACSVLCGLSAIAELLVEIRKRTDRQTYTHTLIAILRTPAECEIKKTINRHNLHSCPIYDDDE